MGSNWNILSSKSKPSLCTYLYTCMMSIFHNLVWFQRDFNVAIASWIEGGIHQKMEKDITTSKDLRGHFDDAFWVRPQLLSNESLTMGHALPAFIILGLGLLPATIAIIVELLHHKYEKGTVSKARIRNYTDQWQRPKHPKGLILTNTIHELYTWMVWR